MVHSSAPAYLGTKAQHHAMRTYMHKKYASLVHPQCDSDSSCGDGNNSPTLAAGQTGAYCCRSTLEAATDQGQHQQYIETKLLPQPQEKASQRHEEDQEEALVVLARPQLQRDPPQEPQVQKLPTVSGTIRLGARMSGQQALVPI